MSFTFFGRATHATGAHPRHCEALLPRGDGAGPRISTEARGAAALLAQVRPRRGRRTGTGRGRPARHTPLRPA